MHKALARFERIGNRLEGPLMRSVWVAKFTKLPNEFDLVVSELRPMMVLTDSSAVFVNAY